MKLTKERWELIGNVIVWTNIALFIGLIALGQVLESVLGMDVFEAPAKYYLLGMVGAMLMFCGIWFYSAHRAWQLTDESEKQRIVESNRE